MPHLSARDRVILIVILVGGAIAVALAITGWVGWAVAVLAGVVTAVGCVARVEFAIRRASLDRLESAIRSIADTDEASRAELNAAREEIIATLAVTRRRLARKLDAAREEIAGVDLSVVRQGRRLEPSLISELQALTQLLSRYEPTAPLPPVAGWALGPAGLQYLADTIERRDAQCVVECGSGTSTLWMAMAMRHKGRGKVIAIEHKEEFAIRTRRFLELHGLERWAEVRLSPLVDVATPRGDFPWYQSTDDGFPQRIDILLVDGPPGNTGRHARYPALPVLGPMLTEQSLVILDDADRGDEREVLDLWAEEYPNLAHVDSPGRGVEVFAWT